MNIVAEYRTKTSEGAVTEEMMTEVTLDLLKKNKGITEYPILEFDNRALGLLCGGVSETLKHSNVKPSGGIIYLFFKRVIDIIISFFLYINILFNKYIIIVCFYLLTIYCWFFLRH